MVSVIAGMIGAGDKHQLELRSPNSRCAHSLRHPRLRWNPLENGWQDREEPVRRQELGVASSDIAVFFFIFLWLLLSSWRRWWCWWWRPFFDRYCFCDFQHSYGRRFIEVTVIGCMCLLRGLSVRLVGSRILGSWVVPFDVVIVWFPY